MGNPVDFSLLSKEQPLPPTATNPADATPPPEDVMQSGSFSERMKAAADKLGVGAGIDGWSKSLVAAGMEALGKPMQPSAASATNSPDRTKALEGQIGSGGGDTTVDSPTAPKPPNAALQAVGGIRNILGDAAAGAEAGGGHRGALTGVVGTLRASGEREQKQMNDRILTAKANAEMMHQQRLMHEMDQKSMDGGAESGQKALAAIEAPASGEGGGQTMFRDQTSDQLHELLAQGKIDPTKQTVFHTGNVFDGKDSNGIPRYRATYSVVTLGGPVTLGESGKDDGPHQDVLNFINAHRTKNEQIPAGTKLESAQLNSMYQSASNSQTFQDSMAMAREKAGVEKGKLDQEADHQAIAKDPQVQKAMGQALTDGGDKSYAPIRAFNLLQGDKDFMAKHPTFNGPIFFGDEKGWNELNKDFRGQADKAGGLIHEVLKDPLKMEGKTPAVKAAAEAIINDDTKSPQEKADAQAVLKQAVATEQNEINFEGAKDLKKSEIKEGAKNRTNPNGLTGAAFIATLPPGRAAALRAINEGSIAVNASALERTDKGQAFMDDIYSAYPDFKAYKGVEWPKAYNEYVGSGTTAKALVRANTAMEHARALLDETTANAILNPLSQAHRDRENTLGLFSGEVGAAVKGGIMTEAEGKALLDTISGGYTVANKRENVLEVSRRLNDRIQAQQDKFDDAKPSDYIPTKPLLTPRAKAAYDYVQSGGQNAKTNSGPTGSGPKLAPNQPPNTTLVRLPAGKTVKDANGVPQDHMYVQNDLLDAAKARGATVIQ